MSEINVGDVVVETLLSGRRVEHVVVALDQPPTNPKADEGPYIQVTDSMRGEPLLIRADHIDSAEWLEVVPQSARLSERAAVPAKGASQGSSDG